MKNILLQTLLLVFIGATLGLAANALSPRGIPFVYEQKQVLAVGVQSVDLKGAERLFNEEHAIFVDARIVEEFDKGHIHGALSLPDEQFDQRIDSFLNKAEEDQPLVCYCSGEDCMSSVYLAEKLYEFGYKSIYVFFGGWPEWKAAGLPTDGCWD